MRALRPVLDRLAQLNLPALGHGRLSYAQEGEDLLLDRIFETHGPGVFIDVGAHHPKRFSNTYRLSKRGWRGLNIDPRPGVVDLFRSRPRDITLEMAVGGADSTLTFYEFKEPALSTFDEQLARERVALGWPQVRQSVVRVRPLESILDEFLPKLGTSDVDLLSVDAEGLDLDVLRSSNWERYRPRVVMTECLDEDVPEVLASDLGQFMAAQGYGLQSKLVHSVLFLRTDHD